KVKVVIVAENRQCLGPGPQERNPGGNFETDIVNHVTELELADRILLQGKAVVKVDPEIADENVEGELRARGEENAVCVLAGVIKIEGIAEADIQSQGIELGNWPESIDRYLWVNDEVALGPVFRKIDVVVILEAKGCTDAILDGAGHQIVGNVFDVLTAGLGCFFAGKRGSNGILRQGRPRSE